MQILQRFIVKGCSRVHLNGVYVYKEHEEGFSKYAKLNDPTCVLTNKILIHQAEWYLIDGKHAVFYARGLDKDSEFPPVGV